MLGNSIAQAGAEAWSAVNQMEKEQKRVRTDTLAAKQAVDFQVRAAEVSLNHEKDYETFAGDPAERVRAHRDGLKNLQDEMTQMIPDEEARLKFGKYEIGRAHV